MEKASIPRHVAIVMDGNGRWAQNRGLPRFAGHQQGVEAVRRAIRSARELSIPYLTLWAFSTENWKRPPEEVSFLMDLLASILRQEVDKLHEKNVRIRVIGRRDRLAKDAAIAVVHSETLTAKNTGLNLTIAFDYGGRSDILQAIQSLAYDVQMGTLQPQDITENHIHRRTWAYDLPEPDLMIRTSGISRMSNFMLWQMAYTELVFLDTLWPDFSHNDFVQALETFKGVERKFGQISPKNL
jgi:undecaprenyl diphosphate synthase